MFDFRDEDWNFAVWIAAVHAAIQTGTMIGSLHAAHLGASAGAEALHWIDEILTFPFVRLWRAAGLDIYDAWFFVPRVPAAILWGTLAAAIRRRGAQA